MTSKEFIESKKEEWNVDFFQLIAFGKGGRGSSSTDLEIFLDEYAKRFAREELEELINDWDAYGGNQVLWYIDKTNQAINKLK